MKIGKIRLQDLEFFVKGNAFVHFGQKLFGQAITIGQSTIPAILYTKVCNGCRTHKNITICHAVTLSANSQGALV